MGCGSSLVPNLDHVDITHFTKIRAIGKGGFGLVHVVTKTTPPQKPDELFAMKTMAKITLQQSSWHLSVAWLERNVLRIVKSPFIPNLHWAFQDRASLYLVMDFLPGGDLGFYIDKRIGLTEDVAVFYAAEVALGIQALHDKYIVHHDIKPSNTILDKNGHARVMDFGLATILEEDNGYKTSTGGGTPGFMPPECIKGRSHSFEPDFFAFGATIYYMFKGRAPFHSNEQMMEQRAVPNSWRGISPVAQDLIESLLKYDMTQRLTDWTQVEAHPFFKNVSWAEMRKCQGKGPIEIEHDAAKNFPMDVCAMDVLAPDDVIEVKDQTLFIGFEYDEAKVLAAAAENLKAPRRSAARSRAPLNPLAIENRSRSIPPPRSSVPPAALDPSKSQPAQRADRTDPDATKNAKQNNGVGVAVADPAKRRSSKLAVPGAVPQEAPLVPAKPASSPTNQTTRSSPGVSSESATSSIIGRPGDADPSASPNAVEVLVVEPSKALDDDVAMKKGPVA